METILETLKGLNVWSVAFRILLSLILGGCIGLDRGRHGRAAGLRTHILVCVGSTIAALVGVYGVYTLNFNSDPLRVGAQVISGIGFLGVGTITVRDHNRVTGLTTAAGLWATASIGLAIGIGFYLAALMAFLAIFFTITVLIFLENRVKKKSPYRCYVECTDVSAIKAFCQEVGPYTTQIDIIPAKSGIDSHVGFELQSDNHNKYEMLLKAAEDNTNVLIALPIHN